MNDMAGKAVRATVERIGKVPRYNITAGVREPTDANRTREIKPLCGKPKPGNKIDALAGA